VVSTDVDPFFNSITIDPSFGVYIHIKRGSEAIDTIDIVCIPRFSGGVNHGTTLDEESLLFNVFVLHFNVDSISSKSLSGVLSTFCYMLCLSA
jgi:hypothetical protein